MLLELEGVGSGGEVYSARGWAGGGGVARGPGICSRAEGRLASLVKS